MWALDITYVPMNTGYMYLLAIMDLKSRYIVGWGLSNTMEASWVVHRLREAIGDHGTPEIINSDQGVRFTSEEYISYVKSSKSVRISMDGKGRVIDNVFIERFWRTIKHEKLYLVDQETGHEVQKACQEFISYYNDKRDRSSPGYLTPKKVYQHAA